MIERMSPPESGPQIDRTTASLSQFIFHDGIISRQTYQQVRLLTSPLTVHNKENLAGTGRPPLISSVVPLIKLISGASHRRRR